MVTDDTTDGGTRDRMMSRDVTGHGAHGGPLDAAFGLTEARQNRRRHATDQNRYLCTHHRDFPCLEIDESDTPVYPLGHSRGATPLGAGVLRRWRTRASTVGAANGVVCAASGYRLAPRMIR